jgi:hypothetical protein
MTETQSSRAADWSNYTTGELDDGGLQVLKDAGFSLIIPQAIDPPAGYPPGKTAAQCAAALGAGFGLDVYLWLWFVLGLDDLKRKLDLIARFQPTIRRLWLDVEDNTVANVAAGADPDAYLDKIEASLELLASFGAALAPGIYTGLWYWFAWLSNSWRFKDRAVWPAEYSGNFTDPTDFQWFGGWAYADLLQSVGTSTIGPIGNIDQSLVSPREISAMTTQPAPPDLNPLVVPFADLADRIVTDQLNAELARKTALGRPATIRRPIIESVRDQTIVARTAALGPRPTPTALAALQGNGLRMMQDRFRLRADRRYAFAP